VVTLPKWFLDDWTRPTTFGLKKTHARDSDGRSIND